MANRTNEFGEFALGFIKWLPGVGVSIVVFVFLVRFNDIVGFVAQSFHTAHLAFGTVPFDAARGHCYWNGHA
jgi:hypothetical protein